MSDIFFQGFLQSAITLQILKEEDEGKELVAQVFVKCHLLCAQNLNVYISFVDNVNLTYLANVI